MANTIFEPGAECQTRGVMLTWATHTIFAAQARYSKFSVLAGRRQLLPNQKVITAVALRPRAIEDIAAC
ncbi:hypothetical protein ACCO45_004457 [Purpureocillium lilacinum]|uniref:Uncharacterized protein n=1 Tax=Purpureocillium lilacinum TaxID=33203 RepID=A0ACC4E468_PURLI